MRKPRPHKRQDQNMTYKWNSPREWLDDKLAAAELTEWEVLAAILDLVDNDTLQDVFQSEMDSDGYFEEVASSHAPTTTA